MIAGIVLTLVSLKKLAGFQKKNFIYQFKKLLIGCLKITTNFKDNFFLIKKK